MDDRVEEQIAAIQWNSKTPGEKREVLEALSGPQRKRVDRPYSIDVMSGPHLCWKGLRPKTQRILRIYFSGQKEKEGEREKEAV
jgi:hypothetical protein